MNDVILMDLYKNREVYCPNSSNPVKPCGDPVPAGNNKVFFTHRRMNFDGFTTHWYSSNRFAVYTCPVCGQRVEIEVKIPIVE